MSYRQNFISMIYYKEMCNQNITYIQSVYNRIYRCNIVQVLLVQLFLLKMVDALYFLIDNQVNNDIDNLLAGNPTHPMVHTINKYDN